MANRRQLVKRRRTVRNIRKITRTMQLIATARFQKAIKPGHRHARPTPRSSPKWSAQHRRRVGRSRSIRSCGNPEGDRSALIVITSNRGLCGGYNGNVLRTAMAISSASAARRARRSTCTCWARKASATSASSTTGHGGQEHGHRRPAAVRTGQPPSPTGLMQAFPPANWPSARGYMRFTRAGVQRPESMQLLPLTQAAAKKDGADAEDDSAGEATFDFSPEPSRTTGGAVAGHGANAALPVLHRRRGQRAGGSHGGDEGGDGRRRRHDHAC